VVIARTDAAASEGIDGAVARALLYLQAGADAIFPEALTSIEMFQEVRARLPGVKLLANMTEFGRSPDLTADVLHGLGYDMVIWPVSSLRVANKAQERLYASLARDGVTSDLRAQMQTRAELYDLIRLTEIEALDRTLVQSVLPGPQP
jgi:methylisocitrate lyase